MPTLHIEHPITDLATWTAAFDAFAAVRREAGVLAEQVRHPVGDPAFVVVDLEFAEVEQAEAFRGFLEANVWAVPANSPALAGRPEATILVTVERS
ncbi:MAG: hypothetical protein H0W25_10410 [Acidimicrobiia bacterium]|nr:hypothetical protein [Acidimicrobiia bacterium]